MIILIGFGKFIILSFSGMLIIIGNSEILKFFESFMNIFIYWYFSVFFVNEVFVMLENVEMKSGPIMKLSVVKLYLFSPCLIVKEYFLLGFSSEFSIFSFFSLEFSIFFFFFSFFSFFKDFFEN